MLHVCKYDATEMGTWVSYNWNYGHTINQILILMIILA